VLGRAPRCVADRSSDSRSGSGPFVSEVETEIVWTGELRRAEILLAAISPDDPDTFDASIVANPDGTAELRIIVKGESLASVRATVDDLLACLGAAESSLDVLSDS